VKNAESKRIGMEVVSLLSPIAARDLLGIFSECIVIQTKEGAIIENGIKYIPHWNVAPLIADWLKASFVGEEKIRPWIEAVKEISSQVTKMNLTSILV
jgi:hypothetical protein